MQEEEQLCYGSFEGRSDLALKTFSHAIILKYFRPRQNNKQFQTYCA